MAGEPAGGKQPSPEVANPRVTWEGCSVLIDINDGDRLVFARLSPAANLKIGATKCSLKPLIGCAFGSQFRVETGPEGPQLVRFFPSSSPAAKEKGDWQLEGGSKDNRALIDNNTAQSLSSEGITAMRRPFGYMKIYAPFISSKKRGLLNVSTFVYIPIPDAKDSFRTILQIFIKLLLEGASGDEIIEALIANSSTFGKKTAFSQEKYKRRKQKKYAPKILLRRPFTRSICEAYFKKQPARIGFLRVDALSLLLSLANVTAYSDVLVVDMVGGLLTGAVAERLGGTGYVCNTYFGITSYPLDIVRMFNLNREVDSRIVQASFADLSPTQSHDAEDTKLHDDEQPSRTQSITPQDSLMAVSYMHSSLGPEEQSFQNDTSVGVELNSTREAGHDDLHQSNVSVTYKSVNPGKQASPEAIKVWKEKGFTSLIIAAPDVEVNSIVQKLLPLLTYSAPFAIYSQYLQPLSTCMHKLQTLKMAIGLQIFEPWCREYQVLPSRTHPLMQMSGFGGYILSGTRICSSEACNGN